MAVHVAPGYYRHYKGSRYEVLGAARHSETLEELVVYRHADGSAREELWVRPASMFCESVVVDGKEVPRFQRIELPPS